MKRPAVRVRAEDRKIEYPIGWKIQSAQAAVLRHWQNGALAVRASGGAISSITDLSGLSLSHSTDASVSIPTDKGNC